VSDEWINKNNSWQSEQRERKEEEADINDLWKPTTTKNVPVKEGVKYDDYAKKDGDMMSFDTKPK
jgi:hypothetical protein